MTDFSPDKVGYEKNKYTEKQQYILDNVVSIHGGDAIAAAKAAGYSNPYQALEPLREELISIAKNVLARYAIPAAMTLGKIMTSEEPVLQANEKIRAAEKILEREIPKQEKVEHSGSIQGGIFILPDKRQVEERDE